MDKIKCCRIQMNLRVLRMWTNFADGGACMGEGRSGEVWGYKCSSFVLKEVKELFEDLVTEGKQFGL
jgi:hypothetical protein